MFPVGTKVSKKSGYSFAGVVVARFEKLDGQVRYVVECTVPGASGMLHIFSEQNLEAANDGKLKTGTAGQWTRCV